MGGCERSICAGSCSMRSPVRLKNVVSLVLAILIFSPWLLSPAKDQTTRHPTTTPAHLTDFNHLSAFADFDGDRKLDQAEMYAGGAYRCIRVRFGNSRETQLTFEAGPAIRGALLAADLNQDQNHDLI